jgi:hypothetical protein
VNIDEETDLYHIAWKERKTPWYWVKGKRVRKKVNHRQLLHNL